jgi:DNA-binding CsgD family transcriptional regulator/hemerythrin
MTITETGNAEIDQQHEILDTMAAQLESLCLEAKRNPEIVCPDCSQSQQQHCRSRLAAMVSDLGAFLVGHATYEERMMELLPDTPPCQAHVKAHKAAHQGVSRQLRKLAAQVVNDPPRVASMEVWRIIGDWLGDHSSLFDIRLVRMSKSASPEMDYDSELVLMLDRHVFPNRPTKPKLTKDASSAIEKAKREVRVRIESLSPTQKNVFWLVVSGKKNSEIAAELGITVNTVKTHRAAIFSKMGVSSVVELVRKTDVLR